MRRDLLLISEMIAAAEQAQSLIADVDLVALGDDRQRREALLWNLTVLGEAAAQVDVEVKGVSRRSNGNSRRAFATASCTGTGRSTLRSSTRPRMTCFQPSQHSFEP